MEFTCSVCDYRSFVKANLAKHCKNIHFGIAEIVIIPAEISCENCDKKFTTKQNLKYHVDNNVCGIREVFRSKEIDKVVKEKLKEKLKEEEVDKLRKKNEELQKKNEELQKKNEELQKQLSTDKLSTSKETKTKPKRKNIPSAVRNTLWMNTYGDSIKGNCTVCERRITICNFHASHIISVDHGGSDHISNLVPACSDCNQSMQSENLEEFKQKYFSK